jgi:dTDP-4-dehydrorhamnose reductase
MILITGANGQLGQCFRDLAAQYPQFPFLFAGSADLDISERREVRRFFNQIHGIRWCINCAAYTAVDKAETDILRARKVNVNGPRNLAELCAEHGTKLIHISTDYVYHGQQNRPLVETDRVSPKGIYAKTKRSGETAALRALPGTMVVRTSWVYAPHGHNFVRTMLRLGAEKPELRVVFDQIGTPTYAPDLAKALLQVISRVESGQKSAGDIAGIWHYSNEGVTSWYDFAVRIMQGGGHACRVLPILSKEYPTPAPRPSFSLLDKSKIKSAFGLEIRHWEAALSDCLYLIEQEKKG